MLFGQVWSRWLHLGGIHSSAQTQNRGWDTSVCSLSLSWFFGIVYVTWTVHSCTSHPHFFPYCTSDFILWIVSLWVSQHTFSAKLHLFLCCGLLWGIGSTKEKCISLQALLMDCETGRLCDVCFWICKKKWPHFLVGLTVVVVDCRYGTLFMSHVSEDITNSPNFSGLEWIWSIGMCIFGFLWHILFLAFLEIFFAHLRAPHWSGTEFYTCKILPEDPNWKTTFHFESRLFVLQ